MFQLNKDLDKNKQWKVIKQIKLSKYEIHNSIIENERKVIKICPMENVINQLFINKSKKHIYIYIYIYQFSIKEKIVSMSSG